MARKTRKAPAPQPNQRPPMRYSKSGNGWRLALPAAPRGSIGYAGHWRTKEDAEKAFADKSSFYYGGFYNGVRGRLTNTQDWFGDED